MDDPSLNTAVILKLVHALDIQSMDDEYVRLALKAGSCITTSSLPGRFWVEFFPFLQYLPPWIPGLSFRHFADEFRPVVSQAFNVPFDMIKEKRVRDYVLRPLYPNSHES